MPPVESPIFVSFSFAFLSRCLSGTYTFNTIIEMIFYTREMEEQLCIVYWTDHVSQPSVLSLFCSFFRPNK